MDILSEQERVCSQNEAKISPDYSRWNFKFPIVYLSYDPSEDHDYFFREKEIWIMSLGFCVPYLRQAGDLEYFWMNEYNGSGMDFSWSVLFF